MNKMWEPEFEDWSEDKVAMMSCELSTNSMSRGEYGVIMQIGTDEENFPIDAAIFWTDEMHLYLRYNWESWYKVSNDDPDNCSNICKRNSATLLLCTPTSIKHHAVKVYHIDRLPEELFGKDEGDASDSGKATQLDFDLPIPSAEDEDDEEAGKCAELSDAAFLASTIIFQGGKTIAHFEGERFAPFSADFYELNGHFIAASYFDKRGDWMADDDEVEDGDTPCWYGAKGIATSPLAIAAKIRTAIAPIVGSETPFHSLILINKKCNITNEICHSINWKDTEIRLVRQEQVADSMLDTVEEALKGYTGDSRPELVEWESRLLEALNAAFAKPAKK